MMKPSPLFLTFSLFSLLLFTGCASYTPGKKAALVKTNTGGRPLPMVISGNIIKDYSSDHFMLLDFSFFNGANEWVRIKDVTIDFGNKTDTEKAHIIVGSDIVSWAKAITKKEEIDDYNRRIFLSALTLGGAATVAVASSKNEMIAGAGALVMLTGETLFVANEILRELTDVEKSSFFPQDHLYREFSVPPGLFTKKWIVLNVKKKDRPKKIFFTLTSLDGVGHRYQLAL